MRQAQQIVNQASHMLGAAHDLTQISPGGRIELRSAILGKRIGKTLNVAQRSTQVVRH